MAEEVAVAVPQGKELLPDDAGKEGTHQTIRGGRLGQASSEGIYVCWVDVDGQKVQPGVLVNLWGCCVGLAGRQGRQPTCCPKSPICGDAMFPGPLEVPCHQVIRHTIDILEEFVPESIHNGEVPCRCLLGRGSRHLGLPPGPERAGGEGQAVSAGWKIIRAKYVAVTDGTYTLVLQIVIN